MTRLRTSRRMKVLLGLMAVSLAGLAADRIQAAVLARSLRVVAKQRILEQEINDPWLATTRNITATVTAAREYVLFGRPIGKVSLFLREKNPMSGHFQYEEVDYFYAKGARGWKFEESAGCADDECQRLGTRAFASQPRID